METKNHYERIEKNNELAKEQARIVENVFGLHPDLLTTEVWKAKDAWFTSNNNGIDFVVASTDVNGQPEFVASEMRNGIATGIHVFLEPTDTYADNLISVRVRINDRARDDWDHVDLVAERYGWSEFSNTVKLEEVAIKAKELLDAA